MNCAFFFLISSPLDLEQIGKIMKIVTSITKKKYGSFKIPEYSLIKGVYLGVQFTLSLSNDIDSSIGIFGQSPNLPVNPSKKSYQEESLRFIQSFLLTVQFKVMNQQLKNQFFEEHIIQCRPLNRINCICIIFKSKKKAAKFNNKGSVVFLMPKKDKSYMFIGGSKDFRYQIFLMRNLSRENLKSFHRESGIPRTLTGQKRTVVKEEQVRVGRFKYDPKDELGKGYSGKVYKGVEIGRSHKRVAIKAVDLKKFKGNNLDMLENEIEIHKSLEHDNIVKLLEVIKMPQYYYLIMEYCPHGNLNEYIAQKKTLSQAHAIEIINQLIEAYKYLLSQGIIHRDIKPANILRVGNKWKISDFGFAARSRFGFKDRMNVGTPLYMAPETLKRNFYSYKSDLYAIGVVLFEMLTGQTPHESGSEKELLEKIMQEVVLPKNIRHPKIVEFLNKLFLVSDAKRMQREQFQNFEFGAGEPLSHTSSCNSVLSNSRKGSVCDDSSLKGNSSTEHSTVNEANKSGSRSGSKQVNFLDQPYSARLPKNPIQINQETLQTELEFVHHFYWLIKNSESLELEDHNCGMLVLTLFKLLLKIMRLLCDKNVNYLQLGHWQEYQQCKLYQQLYSDLTVYSQKYEQEYLQFIKHNDIKVIRAVNRKFPELCSNHPLTSKFYSNLSHFIAPLVHEQEAQIALLLPQTQQEINHNIQALQSLYAVYKVATLRSNFPKQTLVGERPTKLQDYTMTKLSRSDYQHLKRQIKM